MDNDEPLILTDLHTKHSGRDVIIPICIPHINYKTGAFTKAYFFLGNIPKSVYAAVKRGTPARDTRFTEWSEKDKEIIRDYYGPQWKRYLTASDLSKGELRQKFSIFSDYNKKEQYSEETVGGNAAFTGSKESTTFTGSKESTTFTGSKESTTFTGSKESTTFTGGEEINFKDLDFAQEDEDITETSIKNTEKSTFKYDFDNHAVFSNLSIEKEDSIANIKLKLQAISDIQIYRQHLFYYLNGEGPVVPYKLVTNFIPVTVNWRDLNANVVLNGVGIDSLLMDTKSCQVTSEDDFISFNRIAGIYPNFYFIDLYSVISINQETNEIIHDKQQFAILYYGCIIKFWPMLSLEATITALESPGQMFDRYPMLALSQNTLKRKYEFINNLNYYESTDNFNIIVTKATIIISPFGHNRVLNLRNIFDWIKTDNKLIAMKLYIDSDIVLKKIKRNYRSYNVAVRSAVEQHLRYYLSKNSLLMIIQDGNNIISLKLSIDGQYVATANWQEDDSIVFEEIEKTISSQIHSSIDKINKMGVAAFPLGGNLLTNSSSSSLGLITCIIFWPYTMSNAAFKEIKNIFKEYETNEIIETHGIQQINTFVFNFKYNIVFYNNKFLQNIIEKLHNPNTYSQLIDNTAHNLWNSVFNGRQVKIIHRVTDIKIEIYGVNNIEEYNYIKKFIIGMLEYNKSDLLKLVDKVNEQNNLRKLQEQDPDLYDTKKYDPEAEVYARLCQADRQPRIFLKNETPNKNAVKFWNFTAKEPAYYSCDNKDYPNFSFTVDCHPKGFCLPCCKKSMATDKSKSQEVNSACFKEHSYKTNELYSKHILQYGKPINDYRIADCPKELEDGIFLNCMGPEYKFKLIGTRQYSRAVENAGYIFSVAHALSEEDEMVIVNDIADYVRDLTDYNTLGGGLGAVFETSEELADCIVKSFNDSTDLTKFSVGGLAEQWELIVKDIIFDLYDVAIVMFEDLNQNLSKSADTNITMTINSRAEKIICLFKNNTGTYLIGGMKPNHYLRALKLERWTISRRWFMEVTEHEIKDTVYKTIYKFFKENDNFNIHNLLKKPHDYVVSKALLNMRNMCYGAILEKDSKQFYMPLNYSTYPDIEIDYEPRGFLNTKEEVDKMLGDFNLKVFKTLIQSGNDIGYMLETKLCVYFHPVASKTGVETIHFPYDQSLIDNLIIDAARNDIQEPEALKLDYSSKLYLLFMVEFATIVKNNKNTIIREKLVKIIEQFNIKNANILKEQIFEMGLSYNDIQIVKEIITKSYGSKETSVKIIRDTKFDFDTQLLLDIQKNNSILRDIMSKVCVIGEDATEISNIIISCSETTDIDQKQCKGKKLKISAHNFDQFCELLLNDINDPNKHVILLASSSILDAHEFIKYPDEKIYDC